ncbi:MAG: hypothetical protein A2Z20_07175 [Bdellovibrionales bacterium RBG_16_40_8]|nr:MAG: hypothetical protein A2Z20_07175 [Bdellovibrionales bacterium RBG_16_40_8]
MNIRLSRDEIRLRITKDEASKLLVSSRIDDEIFYNPSQRFSFGVFLSDNFTLTSSEYDIYLGIPRTNLELMINGKTKDELECRRKLTIGKNEMLVVFEIDAFTKKRNKL